MRCGRLTPFPEVHLTGLLTPLSLRGTTLTLMKFPTLSLLTLLAALGMGSHAQAVTFGGLNITPRGAQNLNLETGATELPQGGTATDAKGGLTLTAGSMQLKPGQTLSAQNATISVRQGGTLKAAQVTYDLKAGIVTASGGVTYNDVRMTGLSAPSMTLYVKPGFLSVTGGVKADKPRFTGSALAFDLNTMQAMLAGPYKINQLALNASAGAEGRLLLVFSGNRLSRVNAKPDGATLGRFNPYLK